MMLCAAVVTWPTSWSSNASRNSSKSLIQPLAMEGSTMSVLFRTTMKGSLVLYRMLWVGRGWGHMRVMWPSEHWYLPAGVEHVGHKGHRVHTSDQVHDIHHNCGESGGLHAITINKLLTSAKKKGADVSTKADQCIRDDDTRGRPCEDLYLSRSIKHHIPANENSQKKKK